MLALILGLVMFLGVHSMRLYANDWRARQVERLGLLTWKGIYAVVSLVGLVLIIWGYGQARQAPDVLWGVPIWTRHLAALLTIPAFILLVAAYVPGTHMRARVGHPMLLGVKFWALAHLIANGTLADLLLFGGFLVWAVMLFVVLRRRDRLAGITYPAQGVSRDLIAIVLGLAGFVVFAMVLHWPLIGVRPFGG